jgi:hypothetical protein
MVSVACAQTVTPPPAPAAPIVALVQPTIAADTIVDITLVESVSSRIAKPRDSFIIELAEPIKLGEQVLIPSGVRGVGEVVDAGKGGFGGKPGKLVLAARYLDVNGQRLSLRGLKVGVGGKDYSNQVLAVSLVPYLGIASLFMTGGNIEVPAGTRSSAKVSAPFVVPVDPVIVPPPVVSAVVETPPVPATQPQPLETTPASAPQSTEGGSP